MSYGIFWLSKLIHRADMRPSLSGIPLPNPDKKTDSTRKRSSPQVEPQFSITYLKEARSIFLLFMYDVLHFKAVDADGSAQNIRVLY